MNTSSVSEHEVEKYLVDRIEAAGGIAEKTISPATRGYFDRTCVFPGGIVVFCEVKRPKGGHMPAHQRKRHERYRALGATVTVVKSLADADRLVDRALAEGVQKGRFHDT